MHAKRREWPAALAVIDGAANQRTAVWTAWMTCASLDSDSRLAEVQWPQITGCMYPSLRAAVRLFAAASSEQPPDTSFVSSICRSTGRRC